MANVVKYTEDGATYHVGMLVERVDYERDGTPAYQGTLTRIERDGDEITYWITWDGTDASDPHGRYAFKAASEPVKEG